MGTPVADRAGVADVVDLAAIRVVAGKLPVRVRLVGAGLAGGSAAIALGYASRMR